MVFASRLAREFGLCTSGEQAAIQSLIESFNLPVNAPNHPVDVYLTAMGRDKKVKQGKLRFVLNHGIGDCAIHEIDSPDRIFPAIFSEFPELQV
ncbi:MAG: 3-dehydroquinate synthase, partial [Desulfuromonadaceae bacterium]